jgi:hypothetical protein
MQCMSPATSNKLQYFRKPCGKLNLPRWVILSAQPGRLQYIMGAIDIVTLTSSTFLQPILERVRFIILLISLRARPSLTLVACLALSANGSGFHSANLKLPVPKRDLDTSSGPEP